MRINIKIIISAIKITMFIVKNNNFKAQEKYLTKPYRTAITIRV